MRPRPIGGASVLIAVILALSVTMPLSVSLAGDPAMEVERHWTRMGPVSMPMPLGADAATGLPASVRLAAAEDGPAHIIPLFPQMEANLKNGLPPGMTAATFQAGRGMAALRKLEDGRVEIAFEFEGLIPYGVYTLWNVLETEPFKDEPLGKFGAGKHSIVADRDGRAKKVVAIDKWPGKEFLLDYHADGRLSQAAGVYPGALWGRFPPEPRR